MKPRHQLTFPAAAAELLQEPLLQHGRETLPARAPVARMARIYQALSSGQVWSARRFAEDLQCSQRTILRDVEFMRIQLLLPIQYDARAYGFRFVA